MTTTDPKIEYKEAPPAVNFGSLTTAVGTAPPCRRSS